MTTPQIDSERDGLVLGMDEQVYHHGGPEFSASAAKEILRSPAHYKHTYIDGNRTEKKAFDIGTAVHTKVLGTGSPAVAYPTKVLSAAGAANTNDARAWKAEQVAAGNVVVKQAELDEINSMAEAVLAHPDAGPALEQAGWPEASVFATDPDTGLRLRCRFDFLPENHPVALDLKSTRDASLKGFTRAADDFGYDVQRVHYVDTAKYAGLGVDEMVFIAVESTAPYLVNVLMFDRDWIEMGEVRARSARTTLLRCQETGEWPGYPSGVKTMSPPPWVITKFQDSMTEEMEGVF